MHLRFFVAIAAIALTVPAYAATLTLPSITVTSAPSTSIACVPTGIALQEPVVAGAVLFTCTVAPSNWTGAVAISSGPQFVVSGLSGNTFSVTVGAVPLAAGTYQPGTLTSVP